MLELLIVIAILSLLAALLMGVFSKVREKSVRVQCAGNLKQIGGAIQLYMADNNRYMPCMDLPSSGLGLDCSWANRLLPYIRQTTIFECPAYPEQIYDPSCPPSSKEFDSYGIHYRFDGGYDINRLTRAGYRYVHESSLTHPASTIAVLDGAGIVATTGFDPAPDILQGKVRPARHGQGHNVLFADWHIKWMPRDALRERRLWWPQDRPPYPHNE